MRNNSSQKKQNPSPSGNQPGQEPRATVFQKREYNSMPSKSLDLDLAFEPNSMNSLPVKLFPGQVLP
jgi:hypothetical protein